MLYTITTGMGNNSCKMLKTEGERELIMAEIVSNRK